MCNQKWVSRYYVICRREGFHSKKIGVRPEREERELGDRERKRFGEPMTRGEKKGKSIQRLNTRKGENKNNTKKRKKSMHTFRIRDPREHWGGEGLVILGTRCEKSRVTRTK